MADGSTLRWRIAARPRLRFRVGMAMAFALPEDDTLPPVAVVIGPSGQNARWLSGTLGNGVDQQFTIPHGLGTRSVGVDVFLNSGDRETRIPDVSRPTDDTIKLGFAVPPAIDEFAWVIYGPPAQ